MSATDQNDYAKSPFEDMDETGNYESGLDSKMMDSKLDSQVSLENSIDLSDATLVARFTKEERLAEIKRCKRVIL